MKNKIFNFLIIILIGLSLNSCYKEEMRYCWVFEVTTTTIRDPQTPPYPITIDDAISECWLTANEASSYARSLNKTMTWYGSGYSMTEIKVCTKYYIY